MPTPLPVLPSDLVRCEPYRTSLLLSACVERWRNTNGPDPDGMLRQSLCRKCPVGAARAKGAEPSELHYRDPHAQRRPPAPLSFGTGQVQKNKAEARERGRQLREEARTPAPAPPPLRPVVKAWRDQQEKVVDEFIERGHRQMSSAEFDQQITEKRRLAAAKREETTKEQDVAKQALGPRDCLECARRFVPKRSNSTCCSKECRIAHSNKKWAEKRRTPKAGISAKRAAKTVRAKEPKRVAPISRAAFADLEQEPLTVYLAKLASIEALKSRHARELEAFEEDLEAFEANHVDLKRQAKAVLERVST